MKKQEKSCFALVRNTSSYFLIGGIYERADFTKKWFNLNEIYKGKKLYKKWSIGANLIEEIETII